MPILLKVSFFFLFFILNLQAQQRGATPITGFKGALINGETKNTYAVVVGISDYQDPNIPDLRYADKDAEAFASFLRSKAGGGLDPNHIKVLINSQATMAQFANAMDWLWEVCKEDDHVIIYFSGHGDVEKKSLSQPGFLLFWDAPSQVYMAGGAFALPMLEEVIATLSIQNKAKVLVVTDACRSGALAGTSIGGTQATAANLVKQYGNEIKIMSCQPNEYSVEGEQWGGGRGAFSYHLLDALYGLADYNGDSIVSLQEVGRYLEDNVTKEVAPVSQIPIIVGNRNEPLTYTIDSVLASIKSGKLNQMKILSSIESKWIEEEVLAKIDSTTRIKYQKFRNSLRNKKYFEPKDDCAEYYYTILINDPKFEKLHSTIKRNYASALQDDAQQAINIWLKSDVQQLEYLGKLIKIDPIAYQLGRASELLGDQHYMYRSLKARQLLFESISLIKDRNPDKDLGRKCILLLNRSLEFEKQSPLPWHRMSMIYAYKILNPDSAFYCAHEAYMLAPNWVLPYADLAYVLYHQDKIELAKQAFMKAEAIDSIHPYVINRKAGLYDRLGGISNWKKAISLYERYQASGAPLYPGWYNGYGNALRKLGLYKKAEEVFKQALDLDSTNIALLTSMGIMYNESEQYSNAEPYLVRAVKLDSAYTYTWDNLGVTYQSLNKFKEAEFCFKKGIELDSTYAGRWVNLGYLYFQLSQFKEAELALKKSLQLDPSNFGALNTLSKLYVNTNRFMDAEYVLLRCVELDSTYVVPWNNLGAFYLQRQRYDDAELILNRAIVLDPNFANPRKHLGMVCFKTRRPEEARQNFQKALELNPSYIGAMLGMAYLLQSEGKTDQAIGYAEQAIVKGSTFQQLENDKDLESLRALPEWKALMKKYFSDKTKD